MKVKLWLLLFLFVGIAAPLQAHEESGQGENSSRIGANKAVTEISEEKGFKLSDPAKKRLGLAHETLSNSKTHLILLQALVFSRDRVGVYRLRDEWFKFIQVKKKSTKMDSVEIESIELKVGDQIVTQGAGLLRVVDVDLFSETSEAGH